MRSIYRCPCCGHEEEFWDDDLRYIHPKCPKCLILMEYFKDA